MSAPQTPAPQPAARLVDEVSLPAAGTWRIDPGHAEVAFVGRHFLITKVRGRFTGIDGTVTIAEDPSGSRVEVVIDTTTINSGDDTRDAHLRSADLFDVERHPRASFSSTDVRWTGTRGTVTGDLTIAGVTRPVTLDADFAGQVRDPWGGDRAVFSASTTIDREDWGITWNMPLANGGLLVSKEIRLEIEVETIRQSEPASVE